MISLTLVAVIADFISSRFRRPLLRAEDRRILFPAIAVAALLLYLATFHALRVNVYGAGFSPFAPLFLAAAAVMIVRRAPRLASLVLLELVAFDLQLLRSRNLFDYVLDPFVFLVAVGWCAAAVIGHRRRVATISIDVDEAPGILASVMEGIPSVRPE